MAAEDNRNTAKKFKKKKLNFFELLQLSHVNRRIRITTRKGQRECYFLYEIRPKVMHLLQEDGFNVIVSCIAGSMVYW